MSKNGSSRKPEVKSDVLSSCEQTEVAPVKVVKRPFDVAFLMLPDDKKQKQKLLKASYEKSESSSQNGPIQEEIEVSSSEDCVKSHKYFVQKQIFDCQSSIKTKNLDELREKPEISNSPEKSAFTKVNLCKDLRLSPNLSVSPDLNYQHSLSPSPPMVNRNYQMLSPQMFKNQQLNAYQSSFLETFPPNVENPFILKNSELIQTNFPKMRPMFRTDIPYNYQQFPNQEMLKISTPEIRNPAAILTSLLPPSLAALSLPAQNVCAKCNISFRMTSDLVYHMRSHHKNDSVDLNRRKREEKLKCPVCSESFRERHHLTRHMTAHQDKDEDDENNVKKKCFNNVH